MEVNGFIWVLTKNCIKHKNMKKIFALSLAFIALFFTSCIGCTDNSSASDDQKETVDDIQKRAYQIGYQDGAAHAEFNSDNEYESCSPEEAAYLLGYKEGYNKGQSE